MRNEKVDQHCRSGTAVQHSVIEQIEILFEEGMLLFHYSSNLLA